MERNVHFEIEGLQDIVVHLAWAQLEIFADDVEKIQVMAAGDENSVSDLRIFVKEGVLTVEQPQYGFSLNILESRWMQVCVRVPRTWDKQMHINTISGLLSARGLNGSQIALDTVSADLRALRLTAREVFLRTISGDVRGEAVKAQALSVRSVSGNILMDSAEVETLKCNSVSGEQAYHVKNTFRRIDINAVSGDVMITSPAESVNVALRSISGRVRAEGVALTESETAPMVRVTGVSADLKLIAVKE